MAKKNFGTGGKACPTMLSAHPDGLESLPYTVYGRRSAVYLQAHRPQATVYLAGQESPACPF